MKLAKLSLAAIVVAGLTTGSFAAETLADAFKEGKISGELRAWYIDRDKDLANSSSDIFLTGLQLHYKTGTFYGFGLGFTTQTSAAPFADETAKEVKLLNHLIVNKSRMTSKEELQSTLWEDDMGSESAFKSLINKLRSKIGKESIENISGVGYRILLA